MENKKNILIFSTAYYPFVGGAEVAIKEITDRAGSDFEFDLITARFQKNLPAFEKIGRVNVYRLGSGNSKLDKIFLPFRGALKASKLNREKKYFCFWGMMASFGTGAGYVYNIFRKLNGKKKVPIVLTLQEGDSENYLTYKWAGLVALSWKLALRNTDILTAISTFLLKRAEKNGYKGKSFLVPNGVDLKVFSEEISDEVKDEMKQKLGKKDGDVFLATVGRLTHKNGTDDVVRALQLLPQHIQFLIIGKGEDGQKLQRLAVTLGVSDRVKFMGFVDYADIPKYLSVCDIFIRPSRSEGFGNSFIEAMAAGIPVIATPVGGIPDFLDDRSTGLYCAPDSPQSIEQAVMALLHDNSLKTTMITKARERVVERYSWDFIAKEMLAVFDKAV